MSACWKCGKEVPEGQTECPDGCAPSWSRISDDELEMSGEEFKRDYMEVDWSMVKTLEDVIAVLEAREEPFYVYNLHPNFSKVKRFLKRIV
jgi:hypothetical protein